MRIIYLILLMLLVINGFSEEQKYSVKGTFSKEQNEHWIYLVKLMAKVPHIDSAQIINGKFEFSGEASFPEVYGISYHYKKSKGIMPIFIEPANLEVMINLDNWDFKSKVTGGKTNDEYNQFIEKKINLYVKDIWLLEEKLTTANEEERKTIEKRVQELWTESSQFEIGYIKGHSDSPISIFILYNSFMSLPKIELGDMLSIFTSEIQNTTIFKFISEYYQNQFSLNESTKTHLLGYEIELIDLDFKNSSIIKTLALLNPGKLMYIDIWGAWCAPCKLELPYSKNLQERFSSDNIAFIYLCVNSDEKECREIINSESLKGQHFYLDRANSNKLLKEIKCSSIPKYLIVKSTGEVASYDAPRPSSTEIDNLLKSLISN